MGWRHVCTHPILQSYVNKNSIPNNQEKDKEQEWQTDQVIQLVSFSFKGSQIKISSKEIEQW